MQLIPALLLLFTCHVVAFVAPAMPAKKTITSSTQLSNTDQDEIARELVDIVPGNHKAKTHDHAPWKRIMELENAEDRVAALQKELEKVKSQDKEKLTSLEQQDLYDLDEIIKLESMVFSLFHMISELKEEQDDYGKLAKRFRRLTEKRINDKFKSSVDKLLRFFRFRTNK
jgi:hypothetical protein